MAGRRIQYFFLNFLTILILLFFAVILLILFYFALLLVLVIIFVLDPSSLFPALSTMLCLSRDHCEVATRLDTFIVVRTKWTRPSLATARRSEH